MWVRNEIGSLRDAVQRLEMAGTVILARLSLLKLAQQLVAVEPLAVHRRFNSNSGSGGSNNTSNFGSTSTTSSSSNGTLQQSTGTVSPVGNDGLLAGGLFAELRSWARYLLPSR